MRKIFVAGHRGMVGSAIVRQLEQRRLKGEAFEILVADRAQLDLLQQNQVRDFFTATRPDEVVLAAAKVGGIHANNQFPADFIYENLMLEANVIHQAYRAGVRRLLFLGSSCIYPRDAAQPMSESALLTGTLEATNEPYAVAKIAGIKLCESYNRQYGTDFRSVMPTNLYGPNDNFHPQNSHVIPALMRRFHEAKLANATAVAIWGTGTPRREFLHVDDMAAGSLHVMDLSDSAYAAHTSPRLSHINIGTGNDLTIRELASEIGQATGFSGAIEFDPTKPDGAPRKLMDISRIRQLGWSPRIPLSEGLRSTYDWYLQHITSSRS